MKRTLRTYGDSHAGNEAGWGGINIDNLDIIVKRYKGKLMYSFGRDAISIANTFNSGDILCFCFGEIDCRCHINKYEPNWKENINEIVINYFNNINNNVNGYDLTVCVFNVVPPLERELEENLWMDGVILSQGGLPSLGSDEDRKQYTLYMNSKLKEYCDKNNYTFFDVYDKYTNDKGFLNNDLSDKNCHIKNPIYMEEFIKNNLL